MAPDRPGTPDRPDRPHRLVLVLGTGTEVGKTWVSTWLLTTLRQSGLTVAARKPAQSFDPADDPARLDAVLLGAATGEPADMVCLPHRCYEVAMAPPMAAQLLGRPGFTVAGLAAELTWPTPPVDVGLVETAGGVRSPQADDGDGVDLARALAPDLLLLVADAGLGTINSVRLGADALAGRVPLVVVLNRFDSGDDLHRRNREWLTERDGLAVLALPGDAAALAGTVMGGALWDIPTRSPRE